MTRFQIYGTKQADGEAKSPFGSRQRNRESLKGYPFRLELRSNLKTVRRRTWGEAVTALALPLYHTPRHLYKAKRKRREECGWRR